MSKVFKKSGSKQKVERKHAGKDEMADTSDDDFVDPSMDKYFKKKEIKSGNKKETNGKKEANGKKKTAESESDYEEPDEGDEEEEDEEEDDIDENDDELNGEEKEEEDEDEAEEMNGVEDGEKNDEDDGRKKVTKKMIEQWSEKLSKEKPFKAINEVVKAFRSAMLNIAPDNKKIKSADYKVDGSEMFNGMVRLCMRDLYPCLLKMLNLSKSGKKSENETGARLKLAHTGTNWRKLKAPVKIYLEDMLLLAENINEANILTVVLRHVRLLVNFYLCFPKILKSLYKLLITIWSQSDEKSRLISFVCLHKILSNTHEKNQDLIFKSLYLSFVRNSKFTSVNTLPLINFMQRSLIELYSLNPSLAYEHVFVYVRQLAIHLRNAMTTKKKETYQAVYNWQFVHSITLWSKLLSANNKVEQLHSLIYPLVQITMGAIKLIPTPRYYPLRFHCVNALITLSNATNVFIPVVPFILEIFDITDFNKKHATISPKQINFSVLLKLNKQQMQDKMFKDTLVDIIYDNLILLLQHESHDVAFPELVLPLVVRMKDFLKKCKSPNYCKVVKGLLEKIQENCKCIEERRNKITFSIRDQKAVSAWVEKNKELGTPLSQWFTRYKTLREREIMMEISNKEMISKNRVPVVERQRREEMDEDKKDKEFEGLFVNVSDEESDTEMFDFLPKAKKAKTSKQDDDEEEMDEDNFSDLGDDESNEEENEDLELE